MQKFTLLKGLVAPMDRENVDTDAIIPKQFLKSDRKSTRLNSSHLKLSRMPSSA